jgi:hypothetical protein
MRELGDYADVAFSPPFAVGEDVEAGVFLHGDDVADGGFHARLIVLR